MQSATLLMAGPRRPKPPISFVAVSATSGVSVTEYERRAMPLLCMGYAASHPIIASMRNCSGKP